MSDVLSRRPMFMSRSFFFNDTATTEIYTLSLHDALPILFAVRGIEFCHETVREWEAKLTPALAEYLRRRRRGKDRKSTRLNSSHANISYAVFCLKKKKAH